MTKAIAKPQRTIGQILASEDFKAQVALVLPSHLTPERFLRVALTATRKNPKLLQCDQGSFFSSLLDLSQVGLEPDGRLAHLIPYGTECKLIIDYKGYVDLAMRTGKFSKIHADKVCDADKFEYSLGEITHHEINFREDRGEAYAYYAQVVYRDGTRHGDCMTLEEVKAIQKRSKAGSNGPWITDFHEMGKKTVFRRLSKWVPMSPEFREALDADADTIEEKRFANAKPIANSIPNFEEGPAAAEAKILDDAAAEMVEHEREMKKQDEREEPPKAEDYNDSLWLEGKK